MTIIAHSKRLIALDDFDDSQEITTIDLRIPRGASRGLGVAVGVGVAVCVARRRDGTPRAEINARLAQARAHFSQTEDDVRASR